MRGKYDLAVHLYAIIESSICKSVAVAVSNDQGVIVKSWEKLQIEARLKTNEVYKNAVFQEQN